MTTNTHIAAHMELVNDYRRIALGSMYDKEDEAEALAKVEASVRQIAQALEAVPALDAQGEGRNAMHLELLRDLISNDAYALSFQTMGQYRTAILKAFRQPTESSPRRTARDSPSP